jgi:hypothetical protein
MVLLFFIKEISPSFGGKGEILLIFKLECPNNSKFKKLAICCIVGILIN